MDPVLKKLQHRTGTSLLVLGAPEDLAGLVGAWAEDAVLVAEPPAATVLRFIRSCAEIEATAATTAGMVEPGGLLWFAYPKKSSKRYKSDVGRDDSWAPLGTLGYEGVRQVAIDEDWSALRFRPAHEIRTLRRDRSRAMSEDGKRRARDQSQA